MKKIFSKIGLNALFVIMVTNAFTQELVKVQCENGYWGYKNISGKMIISCRFDRAKDFCEDLAAVQLRDTYWGYIDKTGKLVIQYNYQWAGYFYEGLAEVKLDGKWGFIDKNGEEVVPCIYKRSELNEAYENYERDRKEKQEYQKLNPKISKMDTSSFYDIILQIGGKEIKAKVLEITDQQIKYKDFDYQSGPIRNINISEVFMITYENGKKEVFNNKTQSSKKQKPTNCVNNTAFGLDIGIGGAEVKEIFSTTLGIRVMHHFNPYFGVDFLKINWVTDVAVDGVLNPWAMKLQFMPGVRGNSPNFYKCMSVYAAFRLGYGMMVGCDKETKIQLKKEVGKSTNFEGLCLETELGANVSRSIFVGFSYNYHKFFGSFRGRNHTFALRFGFNFGK